MNEDGVDIETNVELRYSNGGIARFKTSALKELKNEATIQGTIGKITVKVKLSNI